MTRKPKTRPIRVDDAVYRKIKRLALANELPNNTLRRLLGLPPTGHTKGNQQV